MNVKRVCRALIGSCFLLTALKGYGQPFTVATVGDSFADSLFYAMRSRPDLAKASGVQLTRWSRPIIGLTRTDYFDYAGWMRDAPELGAADLCFVEIGSNDMQSIPAGKKQWIAYGSLKWKEAYAARTVEFARTLAGRRCGQVLWVLQPGFEKRDWMACHRELINEVQRDALQLERTHVLEIVTSDAAYGPDQTHFNRDYVLRLGPALFQLVDTSRQIAHMQCLGCHRNVNVSPEAAKIFPLQWWRKETAAAVWAPDRVGTQCQVAVVKRVNAKAYK
jgi:hypothetical protein